jgi:hypothetical protein
MNRLSGTRLKRSLMSPYCLALVSFAIFLIAWIFPPGVYTSFIAEPDYLFLDPLTLCFYAACVCAFCGGVYWAAGIWPDHTTEEAAPFIRSWPLAYLLPPLCSGIVYCACFLLAIGGHLHLFSLLASQQGGLIKQALHGGEVKLALLGTAPLFTTAVVWWAADRAARVEMTYQQRLIFRIVFAATVAIDMLSCIGTVDRTSLMPLLAGLMIIRVDRRTRSGEQRISSVAATALGGFCLVVGLFTGLSVARGFKGTHRLIMSLMGYTIVSYNRLAAILSGTMHYQYGGRGGYLFQYVLISKKLNTMLGLGNLWPSAAVVWESEFTSTLLAGLNPMYVWSGTFGYLYADLRWGALVYLLGIGLMAGWAWNRFRLGTIAGRVLYPWIAFCILFWFGWNPLFANYFVSLLMGIGFLKVYELLFSPVRSPRMAGRLVKPVPYTNHA